MLGPDYFWIDSADGDAAYLQHRYACTAVVKKTPEGRIRVSISYGGREVIGTAASVKQGKRFIERWLAARHSGRVWKLRPYVMSEKYRRRQEALGELMRMCTKKPDRQSRR